MDEIKELTEEQKLAFKKLGRKYIIKYILSGMHCVLIAGMMLLILNLACATYAENSSALPFCGGMLIGFFLIRNFQSKLAQHNLTLAEEVKKIAGN